MNKWIGMGRLTKDIEEKTSESGTTIARGTIAVDRRYKKEGQPTADFVSIIAFGKTADFLGKYGRKGTKFVVEGELRTGSYTNQKGDTVYTTDIVVSSVEFAESKSAGNKTETSPANDEGGWMDIADGLGDELPFN